MNIYIYIYKLKNKYKYKPVIYDDVEEYLYLFKYLVRV